MELNIELINAIIKVVILLVATILTKYAIDSMADADEIYRMKRYRSVAGRTYRIYIFKIE